MTDANGTRNHSDKPPAPTNDRSGDKTTLSARRSRRDVARKPSASAAANATASAVGKEGRRRVPRVAEKSALEKSKADRAKRRAGDRRSNVTPLMLGGSPAMKTRANGSTAGRSTGRLTGPTANRSTPPLSLARRRNTRRKTPLALLYLGRLAIAGLGIAAIGGTLLKVLPSNTRTASIADSSLIAKAASAAADFPIALNQEITPLKADLQELPNRYPNLTPKVFYVDVDTRNYVDLDGSDAIAAASTIKLPILLAFFEEVDAGRIALNQTIALLPEQIAEGSGEMQLSAPGTQFTALEVATRMIVGSDNTATNMMIDLLGGPAALNQRFKGYGLQKTQITTLLPDLKGTNTTSAKDLVHTMLLISGDHLTLHSRDRILNILSRTHNKSLLADGMAEREALTYNKTGDIESVLGDVALIDLSNGKRYIVAALVQRPSNDGRAIDLIHSISGRIYKEADAAVQPAIAPSADSKAVNDATKSPAEGATAKPTGQTAQPAQQPAEMPTVEEEPYPSANPSRQNSSGTNP